jgi:hypothetical protein
MDGSEAPQPTRPEDLPEPYRSLHQRIVSTGMFDLIPQAERFEDGEVVVAKHNGYIYYVGENDDDTVHIWYETEEEGRVDDTVPRDDVRPINGYSQIAYQMAEPMTEVEVDRQGHAKITRHPSPPEGPPPPFPGSIQDN